MTGTLCGTSYSGKTFEAHITVEPVEGDRLDEFKLIAANYEFKVADLVMVKDRYITNERSSRDSFCTGWGNDFESLRIQVVILVDRLKTKGFKVWRYKIEQTLLDVRMEK